MLERSSTSEIPGFGILHPDIPGSMKDILEKGCFFCCIDIDKTEHAFYCIDTRNRALLYISNLVCGIM